MRPTEVRVAIALITGSAAAFLLLAVFWGEYRFPAVIAVLAGLCVASLAVRLRFARRITLVVIGLLCLAHTSIALGELPWWVRVTSGVIAAAYAYTVVLLMTKPAREHLDGALPDARA